MKFFKQGLFVFLVVVFSLYCFQGDAAQKSVINGTVAQDMTDANDNFTELYTWMGTIDTEAELKALYNLEISTDILAQQSIGILNDYLLEVDGSPNDDEYARFTANGLEGRTESEFKADFNIEDADINTLVDAVLADSPTLVTPALGTIASGVGTALTALNGENIQDDTIDDDSIDFSDVTLADITLDVSDVSTASFVVDEDDLVSDLDTKLPTQQSVKAYIDNAIAAINSVPIGSVITFMTESAPTGYVECDGSSLLRAGTYADLFAIIGTAYGTADGTHFNLPDLRGYFLRGWDHGSGVDPDTDAGDRPVTDAAGATMTAGDHVGTEQDHELDEHEHTGYDGSGFTASATGGNPVGRSGYSGSTGGAETRPININVMYCIKY